MVNNSVYTRSLTAGCVTTPIIHTEAVVGEHLSLSAKSSITTSNRNLLRDSIGLVESSTYFITEYEATELLPDTNYTIVVEGYANEGQEILVKFNDGAYGAISAPFDEDGIAVIRTTTPSTLTNQKIRLYNSPSLSAIQAEIYWACMYKGFITSPPHDYTPTIEEINERLDEAQNAIGELVTTFSSVISIFYQSTEPTTDNVGDIWFKSVNDIRRWTGFDWSDITSTALGAALGAAGTAQAIADGKIKTYAQASIPSDGKEGDIWIATLVNYVADLNAYLNSNITIFYQVEQPVPNATGDIWCNDPVNPTVIRRWTGSAWIDITTTSVARTLKAIADAQSIADGKIKSYAQTTAPTGAKNGDLWVDTDDNNKLYRWNGTSWASARDTSLDGRVATIETNYNGLTGTMTTIARQTAYTGSLPPTTPTDYASWINTGVTPPGQLRWTGNSTNTTRSYAATKTGASVIIHDLSNDHALNVTVKNTATQPIAQIKATNKVTNGTFTSALSPWTTTNASLSGVSGEAVMLATAQNGSITTTIGGTVVGNKYFASAKIKSSSPLVRLVLGTSTPVFHPGNNEYVRLTLLFTATGAGHQIYIYDNRTSGWSSVYVDDVVVVDLTAAFGAGKPILALPPSRPSRSTAWMARTPSPVMAHPSPSTTQALAGNSSVEKPIVCMRRLI